MLNYPDIPNHQSWVPNYAKAKPAWQAFQNNYRAKDGVDIDAELDKLQETLQEFTTRSSSQGSPEAPSDFPQARGGLRSPSMGATPR